MKQGQITIAHLSLCLPPSHMRRHERFLSYRREGSRPEGTVRAGDLIKWRCTPSDVAEDGFDDEERGNKNGYRQDEPESRMQATIGEKTSLHGRRCCHDLSFYDQHRIN